ncbi:MAG: ABC transporter permease [Eubacteriales bacterium]|nr:ABC transporter permease [Eubacteriales bacterium]
MNILEFFLNMYRNRTLIGNLAKNDFKTRYAGSYLGITWAFIQPVVTVLVYWFVFTVGLKSPAVSDFPFALWLMAGIIPWFFFQEALLGGTSALTEYSYLVKKVVFRIDILPIVKILSALFVHLFFIAFVIAVFIITGHMPSIHIVQVIYYSFSLFCLLTGLVYMTSAVMVFFRDLSQLINVLLQIGIWLTPIMWNMEILPEKFRWIFNANPMFYIVTGYRDAFIYHGWFWQHAGTTIYFWILTILMYVVGTKIFKSLQVHFADVL